MDLYVKGLKHKLNGVDICPKSGEMQEKCDDRQGNEMAGEGNGKEDFFQGKSERLRKMSESISFIITIMMIIRKPLQSNKRKNSVCIHLL